MRLVDQGRHPLLTYTTYLAGSGHLLPPVSAWTAMPAHNLLQPLRRLNRSSPGCCDQHSNILHGEEYKRCVPSLQDDDLAWLVDYLDEVRHRPPLSPLFTKPAQALGNLDLPAFRKCLRELRSICGTRAILPVSYTLLGSLQGVGSLPFTPGGPGHVCEGTWKGPSTVQGFPSNAFGYIQRTIRRRPRRSVIDATTPPVFPLLTSLRPSTKRLWCGNT